MTSLAGGRRGLWAPLLVAFLGLAGCAQMSESTKRHELARTQGKYHVLLTYDVESVAGRCKFVHNIVADDEPGWRPTEAELPDYFKTEAAYIGADTVVVRERVGEAYICGPAPLNPDGTRRTPDPSPR
jgi:phosphatidylethanolamine-binding protein (PEBP) family uncharacterized protein